MKKWNLFLLVLFGVCFFVSIIPLFNWLNAMMPVYFFSWTATKGFSRVYIPILLLGMINWAVLLLYVQSLLRDVKRQDATKFDLNK